MLTNLAMMVLTISLVCTVFRIAGWNQGSKLPTTTMDPALGIVLITRLFRTSPLALEIVSIFASFPNYLGRDVFCRACTMYVVGRGEIPIGRSCSTSQAQPWETPWESP